MTKIRAILVAALLALLAPSLAQAEDWTEYCYTEYVFFGWTLMERHVCVDIQSGHHNGPWRQYRY